MTLFLVIGSNSFSGANFIEHILNLGHNAIGVSRSKEYADVFLPYKWGKKKYDLKKSFKFFQIDLNHNNDELVEIIDKYKPEYIVNFAAQGMVAESWEKPKDWYQTNLISQVVLHDELRKRKFIKKYVHFTTPEVYGNTNNNWIKENNFFKPTTPYAVSRAACDLHLQSFFNAYDFPVIFTRAANVYDPGQQLYRIIPRTILAACTGKKMELHGNGKSIRSFIYIKDVAEAVLKLTLNADPGTSWHISTNDIISIKDLVKKIFEIQGVEFDRHVTISKERLGKDYSYLLDSSAIRRDFAWQDKMELINGIKNTIYWVESNIEKLELLPWVYQHKT